MKRIASIAAMCLCLATFLPSQPDGGLGSLLGGMNDHMKARQTYQSAVITAAPSRAVEFASRTVQGPKGPSYVFVEKADNAFSIVFSSSPANEARKAGDFIIRRGINPNLVKYIKILLNDGGTSYALLEPHQANDKTYLKVVSGDKTLYSRIVLIAPIYTLYTRSAEYILGLAGSKVDWVSVLSGVPPSILLKDDTAASSITDPTASGALPALEPSSSPDNSPGGQ
jgi:hypothetical protein